jgi:alpha-mannosidase
MLGVHDDRELIEARIQRALFERILPAVHGPSVPFAVAAWTAPGEPVSFDEAMRQSFTPFAVGEKWARPWGTTWYKLRATVPSGWSSGSIEAVIDLGFQGISPGFQAEGMVWNADGSPRSGVHPDRRAVPLDDARPGSEVEIILEAAANPGIGSPVTPMGAWETAGERPLYTFRRADLAIHQREVGELFHDINVLYGTMKTGARDDARRQRILRTLERAFDVLDLDDIVGSAAAVRAALAPALLVSARASAHQIVAVGHAHIDSAWLWPLRETIRKCARTFSSAVDLMDREPAFRFACSQAQQYAWMEDRYPELFARIAAKVADGKFLPVGGMWVEADMNLPSGESIARQLVHGQRYFESRFGIRCREVWIPDVFGYPDSLPQIFAAGGCDRFITQKLSWNKQNQMPHHTFRWTGIDGTHVLAHFPPVDTYNATVSPNELAYAAKNFRDDAWSNWSLMPYGHGNGGGGPTREMVARAHRVADLDGLPRVHLGTVDDFFTNVEADIAADPAAAPEWRGELYFEMHRGTFTSQSNTKIGNRRAEHLLREAELWWAYLDGGPRAELDDLWKSVLLLQFHDIIPGSSIAWVYDDAERDYARVHARLDAIIDDALERLAPSTPTVANPATHARDEIVESPIAPVGDGPTQLMADGSIACRLAAPGLGVESAVALATDDSVLVDSRSMRNNSIAISWDSHGRLTSVRDLAHDRECLPAGALGATIELAPDFPNEYDAWDLESWVRRNAVEVDDCSSIEVVDAGPLVGRVRVTREFGPSRLTHTYVLRAGSARLDLEFAIDWHHREHLLSVAFPLDVHAAVAHCDIQFGHVARPTHANTSWDAAKFEVCAHRWVDITEPGFGVAVLNNGRYGHAVQHPTGSSNAIRVSLQRGSRYPDPMADDGHHEVTISLLPHGAGLHHVIREAEWLNLPMRVVTGTASELAAPLVTIDAPGVLVSAVKRADDGNDLVLRAWEAVGDRATLGGLPDGRVRTNLLEEPMGPPEAGTAALRPFELVTWRL